MKYSFNIFYILIMPVSKTTKNCVLLVSWLIINTNDVVYKYRQVN